MDVLVRVIAAVNPLHQRSPVMEVCKTFVDSMALGMGDNLISALKSNQVLTPRAEPVSECIHGGNSGLSFPVLVQFASENCSFAGWFLCSE